MTTVPTDFQEATKKRDALETEYNAKGRALKALSGGGPMGLTPDSVKASPTWKTAKHDFDAALATLRTFNSVYTKRFKKEIAQRHNATNAFVQPVKP